MDVLAPDPSGPPGWPVRSLLVVAGLPGAGKTTLLRRVPVRSVPPARVVDPEHVRDVVRRHAPWLPYGLIRPAVHAVHLLRLAVVAGTAPGPVLVADPATRATRRLLLRAVAAVTGREAHLIVIDVDEAAARASQVERGRVLSARSMRRHATRYAGWRGGLRRGSTAGFASCLVLDRGQAAAVVAMGFGPYGPALSARPCRAASLGASSGQEVAAAHGQASAGSSRAPARRCA